MAGGLWHAVGEDSIMRWNRLESLCERGKTTHRLRPGREHPWEREDEVDGRTSTEYGIADQVTLAGHRGTGSGRNRGRAFGQPQLSRLSVSRVCCCQYPAAGSEMA